MKKVYSVLDDVFVHLAERYVGDQQGHTHWGPYGAAGLLIRHRGKYLLQKRSLGADYSNTWGIPGGALERGESPQDGAYREAREEMGEIPNLKYHHTHTDDHGGWAYHTIVADAPQQFIPSHSPDKEATNHGWFTREQMKNLNLHPGFAASIDKVLEGQE